jgi:AcrR family transcriptional regulator
VRALPASSLLKIPRQHRSAEMVHAILDGATAVLERDGIADFSTNSVARVSGVSIGSLYQYFANKEMILAGILERGMLESEQAIRTLMEANRDAPMEVTLRTILAALMDELEPSRDGIRDILSATPFVADAGVLAVLETRIGDLIRDYLLRRADRYEIVGGPATFYVRVNATIYVFLKWLTDRYQRVTREEILDSIAELLVSVVREKKSA